MKITKLTVMLIIMLLVGCSKTEPQINEKAESNSLNYPESPQCVSDVDLFPLFFSGLDSDEPNVKWYSIYKMLDYYNTNGEERNKIVIDKLQQISEGSDGYIASAAEFVRSIFNNELIGQFFATSPTGQLIVFNYYNEAQYNDGIAYIFNEPDNDGIRIQQLTVVQGSISGYTWSPDSKKICIGFGGRIWSDIAVFDVESWSTHEISLFQYIIDNKELLNYEIGINQRPDPYINIIEWSPDSTKLLLSYSFTDDSYAIRNGIAILDIKENVIESATDIGISEGYEDIEKPSWFTWEIN